MIKVKLDYHIPGTISEFMGRLKPTGRHLLFSAAAASVCNLVRRHISGIVPKYHRTAQSLGASATGHFEKAARKTVFAADAQHGEVVIPAPGFSRAFHDIVITPKNAAALTLPISMHAYGHRVKELSSYGWKVFRPKGHDVLMGERDGEVVPLYLLKKRVSQRQDRALLPSDKDIRYTAVSAIITELKNVRRKAA